MFLRSKIYSILKFLVSDSIYIKLKYFKNFGKFPNISNPQSFNEKITWLKIYDHNSLYTKMVDKFEAKKIVGDIIGHNFIIPTYGTWDRADEIDFEKLPKKFVIKATHDSGRVIICHDKSKLDKDWVICEMKKSLERDFYALTREWPYKNVKPRIIAEMLLENDQGNSSIYDYKFFCFNGVVKFMKVDFNRHSNHGANYYDRNFNILKFGEVICPPDFSKNINRPHNFDLMINLAEKLACSKSFVRIDFYEVNNHVFFGEATFYPNSGVGKFIPESADLEIGKLLTLPL